MNPGTIAMEIESLEVEQGDDDDFFDSCERLSTVVPLDMAGDRDGDEDEFFEANRMSFVSASIKRVYSIKPVTSTSSILPRYDSIKPATDASSILPSYDMWTAEPGDVKERRKRLLQDMGLSSNKDLIRLKTSKVVRAISIKAEPEPAAAAVPDSTAKPDPCTDSSALSPEEESKSDDHQETKKDEPSPPLRAIVFVRSRSDTDIEIVSNKTKQRKEELIGPVSKNKLTRTLSGQLVPSTGPCQHSSGVRVCNAEREIKTSGAPAAVVVPTTTPTPNIGVAQCVSSDSAVGTFFLIKNLDTGKDFIVKEFSEDGMWDKVNDLQTGKQLTMEEFEKSVGYSPVVKELMRRASRNMRKDGRKNSLLVKNFRNSTRKGSALLKNIKGSMRGSMRGSMGGLLVDKEQENSSNSTSSSPSPQVNDEQQKKVDNSGPQWVDAQLHGKSMKEFSALHLSQEIQAHEGSIWAIKFSSDARFLASAGEDTVIHVWEVHECEVRLPKPTTDDSSSSAPDGPQIEDDNNSSRDPIIEIVSMPSDIRKKGKKNVKENSLPEYVKVPDTAVALSEKPMCTLKGHKDEVLDLSWSKSQQLLSSSMDKTVRMWDLETQSCLKIFSHSDYVTCVQFNPVAEKYFISGSLDGKVRIWSTPDRQVVDWTDVREMVTAASYNPDGQGAIIGTQQGNCRMYSAEDCRLEHRMDIQKKKKPPAKKFPALPAQAKKIAGLQSTPAQPGKITGFQFAPQNASEVLITSADSRIGIYSNAEQIVKLKGFKNTSSQISACFSPDGRHIISASEDSQVYIWKLEEPKNQAAGKKKTIVRIQAHEHFNCKDVSAAIPWPGSTKTEPPVTDLHSKTNTKEDNSVGASNSSSNPGLPPLPKKKIAEETTACANEDSTPTTDPAGTGTSESTTGSSSAAASEGDQSPSVSACPSQKISDSVSSSTNQSSVQATAWGLVILTASSEGEIRVYHNFGLPLKLTRNGYVL